MPNIRGTMQRGNMGGLGQDSSYSKNTVAVGDNESLMGVSRIAILTIGHGSELCAH